MAEVWGGGGSRQAERGQEGALDPEAAAPTPWRGVAGVPRSDRKPEQGGTNVRAAGLELCRRQAWHPWVC